MNAFLTKYLGLNWRTNLAAIAAFLATVPAVVAAAENWAHHQPVDWRGAAFGLFVSAGIALAKDSKNKSTLEQVKAEQAKVDADDTREYKQAELQAKAADDQAKGSGK